MCKDVDDLVCVNMSLRNRVEFGTGCCACGMVGQKVSIGKRGDFVSSFFEKNAYFFMGLEAHFC